MGSLKPSPLQDDGTSRIRGGMELHIEMRDETRPGMSRKAMVVEWDVRQELVKLEPFHHHLEEILNLRVQCEGKQWTLKPRFSQDELFYMIQLLKYLDLVEQAKVPILYRLALEDSTYKTFRTDPFLTKMSDWDRNGKCKELKTATKDVRDLSQASRLLTHAECLTFVGSYD